MVAVGDVYELGMQWTEATQGTVCVNVFHFRQKAGFLSAINLIGEFQAGVQTDIRSMIGNGMSITKYTCRSLIPHNTDYYETTLGSPLAGLAGTDVLPPQMAAIITWRTGQIGRRKRGRSYFAGIVQNWQTGGRLSATVLGNQVAAVGNKFLSLWGAGGSSATTEFGVWSRVNAGDSPPYDPAGFTVCTSYTAQPSMGLMGTRRWGRGI